MKNLLVEDFDGSGSDFLDLSFSRSEFVDIGHSVIWKNVKLSVISRDAEFTIFWFEKCYNLKLTEIH